MFAGTNIDDLIVLTVLFLSARVTGEPRGWQIWVGQYLGIGALIAVSVLTALGLTFVPDRWVGLLGFVPLVLGVRGLFALRGRGADSDTSAPVAASFLTIAGVTIANGADNISVYVPVFRTIGAGPTTLTIVVFLVGVVLWCVTASWLASHKKIICVIERQGHWLVPVVFIAIGLTIIVESGVVTRLA